MKKTADHPARTCLERIPEGVPLGRAACGKALEAALAAPSLDERTACSRLLWLLDPRPEGLRLAEEIPGLTPEILARHIVHPREAVLGIIQRRTGLDAGLLDRIYECLSSPGGPENPDRLADMPEERILQEMKWWLVDLRFPEYYLRNTPPDVIAAPDPRQPVVGAARRQVRDQRAHEGLHGLARGHADALGAPQAVPRGRGGDRAGLRGRRAPPRRVRVLAVQGPAAVHRRADAPRGGRRVLVRGAAGLPRGHRAAGAAALRGGARRRCSRRGASWCPGLSRTKPASTGS